ncbi:MAG: DegV family protein [Lachnospiraceae bacterium]|nr:DegV family protein [Lachnospiraceae bacterium]
MNQTAYDNGRMQSVHLSIVVIQTLATFAITAEAFLLGWELWVPPLLFTGVFVSWFLYVQQLFTERGRLYLYAVVIWALVIYHAVHVTSVYDFAAVSLMEMVLFSQTNEKRLVRISLLLFFLCTFWHVYLYFFTDTSIVVWDLVTAFRILLFVASNVFVCWISLAVINQRLKDRKLEEGEIVEMMSMQKRSEDFLANVSHELRTPINAVLGIGSVIRQDAAGGAEEANAEEIYRAGRCLSTQVEDMLDYTELDTGTITVIKEPYDISSVLNDVAVRLGLRNAQFPFEVRMEIDSELPARLTGDANIVKKLLRLSIGRALADTEEGTVEIRVYGRKREYGINLDIEVKDTGQGLTKAQLEDARSEKYRVLSERTTSSMGLGLTFPIMNGLAEAMGGFCNISSVWGEGTRVHISIPQGADENAGVAVFSPDALSAAEQPQTDVSFEGLRVLVVDDEPMNLTVAESIFSGYGMAVETAGSGEEAIRMAQDNNYQIIFMDHMMPGMDGVECMHRIRSLREDETARARFVALTANASSTAREMFFAEGFDAFLAKPIDRMELIRVLKTVSDGVFFTRPDPAGQEREILTEQQNQIELLHLAHNTAPVTKVHNETGDGEKHAVQIAVDSGSDLPAAWVEYYRIAVINNHIRTDRGVFEDVLELNSSALFRYMDGADHTMHSDPPSVEEFRDFFARLLEKAGRVVFITLGKHASKSFERASAAAKQFRQVTVIDSGHLSSAAGMLAVYAAHLSQTEPVTDGFFDKTDQFRQRIRCSLLLDNTGYMARNGKIGAGTHKVMQAFLLHPVITAKNGAISTAKIFMGNPASVREKYIRYAFARENRIDPSLVIVVYAGLPDSERKEIGAAVLKQMPAARIVFQELSAALAGNAGPGTFGFIYCETDIREKDGAFGFLPESLLKENVL